MVNLLRAYYLILGQLACFHSICLILNEINLVLLDAATRIPNEVHLAKVTVADRVNWFKHPDLGVHVVILGRWLYQVCNRTPWRVSCRWMTLTFRLPLIVQSVNWLREIFMLLKSTHWLLINLIFAATLRWLANTANLDWWSILLVGSDGRLLMRPYQNSRVRYLTILDDHIVDYCQRWRLVRAYSLLLWLRLGAGDLWLTDRDYFGLRRSVLDPLLSLSAKRGFGPSLIEAGLGLSFRGAPCCVEIS